MFPYWSRSTERALLDLQRAKQHELDEYEAAAERIVEQAHEDGDGVIRGVTIPRRDDGREQ